MLTRIALRLTSLAAGLALLAGSCARAAEPVVAAPPSAGRVPGATPREVVFVVDTRASMCGVPLETAKRALVGALAQLGDEDRFNVFRFGEATSSLYRVPVPRTPDAYSRALAYVADFRAGGTADMTTAMRTALARRPESGYSRIVVVLTREGSASAAELRGASLSAFPQTPTLAASSRRREQCTSNGRATLLGTAFGFGRSGPEAKAYRRTGIVLLVGAVAGIWLVIRSGLR